MQEAIFINKLQKIVVSELECVIYTVQKDEQDHTQKFEITCNDFIT